jgi:hypothetical protein
VPAVRRQRADHQTTFNFVAFVSDDDALISTDVDGNLILRPLTERGYPTDVVSVELGS